MSLFGFGDITFNKENNKNFGPLSALEGSDFQKNTYRYPLDVGNYDKGHYMVIYVRQQRETKYKGSTPSEASIKMSEMGNLTSKITSGGVSSQFGGGLLSKVNGGLNSINSTFGNKVAGITNSISQGVSGAIGGLNNLFGQATVFSNNSGATKDIIDNSIKKISDKSPFGFLNTTSLTTDAIALYMPDTLLFNHTQNYEGLTPGNELLGQLAVAAPGLVDAYKKGGSKELINAAVKTGAAQKIVGDFFQSLGGGQTAQLGLFSATGKVINPMLELIYRSPNFRTFQFDFFFYPRDEKEAYEVQKIIERLRFHQAPELSLDAGGKQDGLLIPPSEFDIKFYYGGSQNPNIPPIASCVLESIDINYAPNGFSAYEVPGETAPALGRTGMPVAIQLTLQFKETTYLTKQDFKGQGSNPNVNNTNFSIGG